MIRQTEDKQNWYEDEFPPKKKMMSRYYGYETWNECVLFHEFAINMYDIVIKHRGNIYRFDVSTDGVVWTNPDTKNCKTEWDSPVEFLKDFCIENRPLCEVVNEIEEIEWV